MERDWVKLKIDDDRMTVSLSIKVPYGEETTCFSPEFIEEYLYENGINAGVDKNAIAALSEYTEYGHEIVVAKGKKPVNGKDGTYQFNVRMEDIKDKPAINEDGSVDYYNSLKLATIKKDELFAVYVPPTPGEYGYTVFAEMIPPAKGRELRPLRGKGFTISEDGREYRAQTDGRIYKDGERIIIENLYVVKGDLDIEQGNLSFNGDVEIKGDVRSGLTVNAEGNIYVHGHVGACHLISGGKITIRKGIQGRNKCTIASKGDVICSFIERCTINAGGDVYADSILDCDIAARNKVYVNSRKGIIVGGNVSGMQGILAKEVGNDIDVATMLTAGVIPEYMREVAILNDSLEKVNGNLELLDRSLKMYDKIPGDKRTKETESVRMKIIRAKVMESTRHKMFTEQLEKINAEIDRAKEEANVRITGIVHAGTRISMGGDIYSVKEDLRDVEYRYRNYKVVQLAGDEKEAL